MCQSEPAWEERTLRSPSWKDKGTTSSWATTLFHWPWVMTGLKKHSGYYNGILQRPVTHVGRWALWLVQFRGWEDAQHVTRIQTGSSMCCCTGHRLHSKDIRTCVSIVKHHSTCSHVLALIASYTHCAVTAAGPVFCSIGMLQVLNKTEETVLDFRRERTPGRDHITNSAPAYWPTHVEIYSKYVARILIRTWFVSELSDYFEHQYIHSKC